MRPNDEIERHIRALEMRMSDSEKTMDVMRNELGALRQGFGAMVDVDKAKGLVLDAQHTAYAAASQRADIAERRADRAESRVETLEREVDALKMHVDRIEKKAGVPPSTASAVP